MPGEISKEALEAFTLATIKSATELEKIVSSLQVIVEKQDKIVDRVFNGMVHEIVDGITKNYDNTHKETVTTLCELKNAVENNRVILTEKVPIQIAEKLSVSSISEDIKHTKWIVAIATGVIIVVTVMFKLMGYDNANRENRMMELLVPKHTVQTGGLTNELPVSSVQK